MPAPEPKGRGPWRQLSVVLTMGFGLVAAVVIGWFVGAWIDSKLGTSPWFALLFLALGFVAGLLELFRELKNLNGNQGN
jgi:ATP synthase protein I